MGKRRQRKSSQSRTQSPQSRIDLSAMSGPGSTYTPIRPPVPRPQNLHYPHGPPPYAQEQPYPADQPGAYKPHEDSLPDPTAPPPRPFPWATPEDFRAPRLRNGQFESRSPAELEYLRQHHDFEAAAAGSAAEFGTQDPSSRSTAIPGYEDGLLTQDAFERMFQNGNGGGNDGGADPASDADNAAGDQGPAILDPGAAPSGPPFEPFGYDAPAAFESFSDSATAQPTPYAVRDPLAADASYAVEPPSLDNLVDNTLGFAPFDEPPEDPIAAAHAQFNAELKSFAEPDPLAAPSGGGLEDNIAAFYEPPDAGYGGLEQQLRDDPWAMNPPAPEPPIQFG